MKKQIPTGQTPVDGSATPGFVFTPRPTANKEVSADDSKEKQKAQIEKDLALKAQALVSKIQDAIFMEYCTLNDKVCNVFSENIPTIDFSSTVNSVLQRKLCADPIISIINHHEQAKLFSQTNPGLLATYKTIAEAYENCLIHLNTGREQLQTLPPVSYSIGILKFAGDISEKFVPTMHYKINSYLKTLSETLDAFRISDNNTEPLIAEIILNDPENMVGLDTGQQAQMGGDVIVPADDGT